MPGFYTEADYENSIIELFQNMGYHYVYGPDVDRDFSSPLYEVELDAALHCLNPTMPEDAIADALFKLKNFENAELVQKNVVFMDYIQQTVMLQCELWTDNNDMRGQDETYAERLGQYAKVSYDIGRESQDLIMVAEEPAPYEKKENK